MLDLQVSDFPVERNKKVGAAQVAIILGNFVFQDEMVSPCVPGQLIDDPVILVKVVSSMRKDEVGRRSNFQGLEILFNFDELGRKETVAEIEDNYLLFRGVL